MTSGQAWLRKPAVLLLLAAACGGEPTGPGSGSLAVSVSGLPGGAGADVTVTGPAGYHRSLTASVTLTGLTPGSYSVAAEVVSAGALFYGPSPSTQSVTVAQGETPATAAVAYSPATGSLTVSVTGLPPGTDPAITVTGPGGYNQSLTAPRTLSGITPGSYTVTALAVSDGTDQYSPSPSSQAVTVEPEVAASATVAYATGSEGGFNLRVDGLYLVQSVQTYARTVPLVRDRDALLRVFVTANQVNTVAPAVRVRLYSNGSLSSTSTIAAPGLVTPQTADEGNLAASWNLIVPKTLIQPNLSILVDVDPANQVAEGNEADNAFPAGGAPLAVDVRTTSPFSVRFVPVQTSADGRQGNVSDGNKAQFLTATMRMHPLAAFDADVRAPYTTTTTLPLQAGNENNAWNTVLAEIDARRTAEGSSRYYYGVVSPSYGSGVAGVGYIGWPAAIGWDNLPSGASVAAHEWGHNWGRQHAPCGGAGNPDTQYPYSGGVTGAYGYDQASAELMDPAAHDLMGYCSDEWISDYTYTGVLGFRAGSPAVASELGQAVQPALLVWGRIENGRAVLEPAFQITTRPSLPARPGPYRIEGRAADGTTVFGLSFTPLEVADARSSAHHFSFAVPLQPDRANRVASLHLDGRGLAATVTRAATGPAVVNLTRGPDGRVGLRWDASLTPMVMVRDPVSGDVLSFARGGRADLVTTRQDLSLVLSDRVRSRDLRVAVPSR